MYMYMYMYICMCMCMCMCTCIRICIYVYIYIYVCMYVCMYVYIYIYTHTYIYSLASQDEGSLLPSRALRRNPLRLELSPCNLSPLACKWMTSYDFLSIPMDSKEFLRKPSWRQQKPHESLRIIVFMKNWGIPTTSAITMVHSHFHSGVSGRRRIPCSGSYSVSRAREFEYFKKLWTFEMLK